MSTKTSPFLGLVNAPEFPKGLVWHNTEKPVSLNDIKGRFTLIKFWTYGCINCLHTLDEVDVLRKKFRQDLVVIAVHTGKFPYERNGLLLSHALEKIGIDYPVVEDPDYKIWEYYTIQAWPSFILIAPNGKIIGQCSGEGSGELLSQILSRAINYWVHHKNYSPFHSHAFGSASILAHFPLGVKKKTVEPSTRLNYPTGLSGDSKQNRLFISDTGNHRILTMDHIGEIKGIIGGSESGFCDGKFDETKFQNPRGVFYDNADDALFIADEGNHAIRKASLKKGIVETIAGNGKKSVVKPKQGSAIELGLNSPWDIIKRGDSIFVAMAGVHQLWEIDLQTSQLRLVAGSGREELYDSRAELAALAQPSSLLVYENDLLFLDTESSAFRSVTLNETLGKRLVKTLIGKSLFSFGDKDGLFEEALLQHPRGLARHRHFIYLSDSYNHKIKRLDMNTGTIQTLIGGTPVETLFGKTPLTLSEPEGLAILYPFLFIADSNHHRILKYNLETSILDEFEIKFN